MLNIIIKIINLTIEITVKIIFYNFLTKAISTCLFFLVTLKLISHHNNMSLLELICLITVTIKTHSFHFYEMNYIQQAPLKVFEKVVSSVVRSLDFYKEHSFNIPYNSGLNMNFVTYKGNLNLYQELAKWSATNKIPVAVMLNFRPIRPESYCLLKDFYPYAINENLPFREYLYTPANFYKNLELQVKYEIAEQFIRANYSFHPNVDMAATYIQHIKRIYIFNIKHLHIPEQWISGSLEYQKAVIQDFNSWSPQCKEIYCRSLDGFYEASQLVKPNSIQKLILKAVNDAIVTK